MPSDTRSAISAWLSTEVERRSVASRTERRREGAAKHAAGNAIIRIQRSRRCSCRSAPPARCMGIRIVHASFLLLGPPKTAHKQREPR